MKQCSTRALQCLLTYAILGMIISVLPGNEAAAQNSGSAANGVATLTGTVRDEVGPVNGASVVVASHGMRRQTITAPDGSFQFTDLQHGKYMVCARAEGKDLPYVDSCLWHDRGSQTVTVAPRQAKAVVVPLQRGHLLQVRVNDPGHQLPVPIGRLAGNDLSLAVVSPSGLVQQIPILKQDSSGRDHGIVIPYDTSHKLIVRSSTLLLKDSKGEDFDGPIPANVKVPRGTASQPFVVNAVGRKPSAP